MIALYSATLHGTFQNGLLTSLPYLTCLLTSFGFTAAADFVRDRGLMKTVTSRKFFNALGEPTLIGTPSGPGC